jgi:hypothetical protein
MEFLAQKWHWDGFFPECFGFSLSLSFHRGTSHFLFICNRCCVTSLIDRVVKHPVSCFRHNRENGVRSKPKLRCVIYFEGNKGQECCKREEKTDEVFMNEWTGE